MLHRIGTKLTEWVCGIMLPYTEIVGRRVKLESFGGIILIASAIGDEVSTRQNTTYDIVRVGGEIEWPVIGDGGVGIPARTIVKSGKTIPAGSTLILASAAFNRPS